ncbi:hypothetical protein D9M71_586020 [compost metagenome]
MCRYPPGAASQSAGTPARPTGRGDCRRAFPAVDRASRLVGTLRPGHARSHAGRPGGQPQALGIEPVREHPARPGAMSNNPRPARLSSRTGTAADPGNRRAPVALPRRTAAFEPQPAEHRLSHRPATLRRALQSDRQPHPVGFGVPENRWGLHSQHRRAA